MNFKIGTQFSLNNEVFSVEDIRKTKAGIVVDLNCDGTLTTVDKETFEKIAADATEV